MCGEYKRGKCEGKIDGAMFERKGIDKCSNDEKRGKDNH